MKPLLRAMSSNSQIVKRTLKIPKKKTHTESKMLRSLEPKYLINNVI